MPPPNVHGSKNTLPPVQTAAQTLALTGADRVLMDPTILSNLGRIAVVCNQGCYARNSKPCGNDAQEPSTGLLAPLIPLPDAINCAINDPRCVGSSLVAVFGPQHGYYQTEQDNMIETGDSTYQFVYEVGDGDGDCDGKQKQKPNALPLCSLYSDNRVPSEEHVSILDTFVIDVIDIGSRVYTYMITMAGILRFAAKYEKRVIILDRPNPLGVMCEKQSVEVEEEKREDEGKGVSAKEAVWSGVEGNMLDTTLYQSFVGWYRMPFRHGLTIGELALVFKELDSIDVDLSIVKCTGINRSTRSHSPPLSFPVTMGSPNMSNISSCLFFPATVCLEATNMSEGRGTTMPFTLIGAPWFDNAGFCRYLTRVQCNVYVSSLLSASIKMYAFKVGLGVGLECSSHTTHTTHTIPHHTLKTNCRGVLFAHNPNPHIHTPNTPDSSPSASVGEGEGEGGVPMPNMFALGIHLLAYCVAYHREFKWRTPEEGYEYDFERPPQLLILGDERYATLFTSLAECGCINEAMSERIDEVLLWAWNDAQKWAKQTKKHHLY